MEYPADITVVSAKPDDVPDIERIVKDAYSKYVERIGHPPAPMLANYAQLLETQDVYVLRSEVDGNVLGSIVLTENEDGQSIKINNLVVDPSAQGRGYGRVLMDYAENFTRSRRLNSLTLFTNVKMHENVSLYNRLGFVETERKTEGPYERVYFRKDLKD